MEKWTRISYVNDVVSTEETAARERLHSAIEQALR